MNSWLRQQGDRLHDAAGSDLATPPSFRAKKRSSQDNNNNLRRILSNNNSSDNNNNNNKVQLQKSDSGPSKNREFLILPKLLEPALAFQMHQKIIESDDHAFNSDECDLECCHLAKRQQQKFSMENPPKLSAEKRRDHLHLLRRRKSRARFLKSEEQVRIQPASLKNSSKSD